MDLRTLAHTKGIHYRNIPLSWLNTHIRRKQGTLAKSRKRRVSRVELLIGRGDKLENFDLIFFPTSKTWKGLLTTNKNNNLRKNIFGTPRYRGLKLLHGSIGTYRKTQKMKILIMYRLWSKCVPVDLK